MLRHRFDPLSFAFGVLFLVLGIAPLIDEDVFTADVARWIWPALLVVPGIAILASALRPREREEEPSPPPSV